MSAQLSLDSLGGIDWDSPKLAQLEQFAADCVPGCTTRLDIHNSSMSVRVKKNGKMVWIRPSMERTVDDGLKWVVRSEYVTSPISLLLRSDAELEAELAAVFEGE